jgi:hypothetical protein
MPGGCRAPRATSPQKLVNCGRMIDIVMSVAAHRFLVQLREEDWLHAGA